MSGRTVPESPPAVPDLNFNKDSAERVLAQGKRSTVDGRVAVLTTLNDVIFRPFVPEDLDDRTQPLTLGTGRLLTTATRQVTEDFSEFHRSDLQNLSLASVALCDANADTLIGRRYLSSEAQNPVRCANDPSHDCYEVSVVLVIGRNASPRAFEIWTTPVTVEVSYPKQPDLGGGQETIVHSVTVKLNEPPTRSPVAISTSQYPGDFMETPTVSADGRVLVLNGGDEGILYSVWDGDQAGAEVPLSICDAAGWTQFHRLSHAYFDPDMAPYGLGDFQLRDTKGRLVADNEPVRGSYPWVDRSASNVIFSHVQAVNPTTAEGGYAFALPPESSGTCFKPSYVLSNSFQINHQAGLSTVGLWSRGKVVHLDGRANLSSYVISFNQLERRIRDDCDDNSCDRAVGECSNKQAALADAVTVRANGLLAEVWEDDGTPVSVRINEARNTQIFSNENHFNYLPYARSMSPRDVAWVLNTSRNSMDLVFDDLFPPAVLLEASMVPPISWELDPNDLPYFNDGFTLDASRNVVAYGTPWVQNAATARAETGFPAGLKPPDYGVLEGGARIEPIAAGGFEGRGLFLDGGDDRGRFTLTSAGSPLATEVYFGLWLNPRDFLSGTTPIQREILQFPDGTILQLKGDDRIRIKKLGVAGANVFVLPDIIRFEEDAWIHLGVQASWENSPPGQTEITLYANEYPWWTGTVARELFRLAAGDLILGFDPSRSATGFKGWVDELHVVARTLSYEEACNQANGTLVAVDPTDLEHSTAISARYPALRHDDVANAIMDSKPEWTQFYCEIHYPEDDALFRAAATPRPYFGGGEPQVCIDDLDRPQNERCVGRRILFPNGPLVWNLPRPDSVNNDFCGACHTASDIGGRATIDPIQSLGPQPAWAIDDPRRQPSQPAPLVFGVLPELFFGHPNATPTASEHPVDPLVLEEN
ncbi:MAG: hypothetical protein AAGD01_18310 [Acidobacteriota bacterium]